MRLIAFFARIFYLIAAGISAEHIATASERMNGAPLSSYEQLQ